MNIPNPHVPVFIPFGYTGVGKTMLVQRLVRYVSGDRKATINTFDNETILLKVHDRGECKEFCFLDMSDNRFEDSSVKSQLSLAPNPKIWGFMVEYDAHQHVSDRNEYIKLVHSYVSDVLKSNDRVLIICNKMDQVVNKLTPKELIYYVENYYPDFLEPFKRTSFISKLLCGKYSFKIIPFSSGCFFEKLDNKMLFVKGPDDYPKLLWNEIKKVK